jgi:Family of unknown function (DUF6328)
VKDDDWNEQARGETELERVDRNLIELLQELRVAQTGVQILFAFLLTLPFTQRFKSITGFQRDVYFVTLLLAAGATLFIIAPVAYHRILFRQHDKKHLVEVSNRLALVGLVFLALAMIGAILLITDVMFQEPLVGITVAVAAALFVLLWFVAPLLRRRQDERRS